MNFLLNSYQFGGIVVKLVTFKVYKPSYLTGKCSPAGGFDVPVLKF